MPYVEISETNTVVEVSNTVIGTFEPTDIVGLTEYIEDAVSSALTDTTNVTWTYDDVSNTIEANVGSILVSQVSDLDNLASSTTTAQWGYVNALDQGLSTSSDVSFNDLTVTGDLTVSGTTTTINSTTVTTADNIIVLNNGEVGSGVTAGSAGIEIDRGLATNYQFIFSESDDSFKIGEIGSLQKVATRADSPDANGVAYWHNGSSSFITNSTFTFNGTTVNTPNLSVTGTITNPTSIALSGAGSVTNTFSANNGLTWRFGAETTNDATIRTSSSSNRSVKVDNTGTGNADFRVYGDNQNTIYAFDKAGNEYIAIGNDGADSWITAGSTGSITNDLVFRAANVGAETEYMRLFGDTGNLAISTTTDNGDKLQVNGNASVSGVTTIKSSLVFNNPLTTDTTSIEFLENTFSRGAIENRGTSNTIAYQGVDSNDTYTDVFTFTKGSSIGVVDFNVEQDTTFNGDLNVAQRIKLTGFGEGISEVQSDGTLYLNAGADGTGNELLIFQTGDVDRARITETGNFLIGTTTDGSYKLDVNGAVRSNDTLTVNKTASGASILQVKSLASNDQRIDFIEGSTTNWSIVSDNFLSPISNALTFVSPTANVLTLSETNNVLIGTTTDSGAKLSITQSGNSAINVVNSTNQWDFVANKTTSIVGLNKEDDTTGSNWFYRNVTSATSAAPVVFIEQDNAGDDQSALVVQQDGTGYGLYVDQNGNGIGLEVNNAGTQDALQIVQAGVLASGQYALNVYTDAIQTQVLSRIIQDNASSTGRLLDIINDGSGDSIFIDNNGSGRGLNIDSESTAYEGLKVDSISVVRNDVFFYGNSIKNTDQSVLRVEQANASNTQPAQTISNAGTGTGLLVDQNGNGIALDISASATGGNTLRAITTQTSGTPYYFYNGAAQASGYLMDIVMDSAGASATALHVQQDGVGDGIYVLAGNGRTIRADKVGTTGNGLLVYNNTTFTGTGTSSLVRFAFDSALATGDLLYLQQDGSGKTIVTTGGRNDLNGGLLLGLNAETIAATKTLTNADKYYQHLNGGASDRDITLPTGETGLGYVIKNTGSTNDLVVKNPSAVTVITLVPSESVNVIYDGSNWVVS